MALLTHKTSTCADAFPSALFREKGVYGIPYWDTSSSPRSIPSESGSLFDKARSFKDGTAERTLRKQHTFPQLRLDSNDPSMQSEPALVSNTVSEIVLVGRQDNDEHSLSSYEDARAYITADTSIRAASDARSVIEPVSKDASPAETSSGGSQPHVFHKWMNTMLRKPSTKRNRGLPVFQNDLCRSRPESLVPSEAATSLVESHCEASSERFVSAVQTASITMASSLCSEPATRLDDTILGGLDKATVERMMDRKHVLEELITTEEYYIRDLKSLRDQYIPILRECVWVSTEVRQTMARNVTEMLDIHTRLLDEISRALPCTTQMMTRAAEVDTYHCAILADPAAAAEIAKVFDSTARAFFVYEEYSAKYEEVVQAPKRTEKGSEQYGKGIEALTGASNSWDNRGEYGKRAMELYDMLFKPIQRLCKYPLLFRDIAKHTPAMDCPNTNRLLEKVRHSLDEQVHQVNVANSDPTRTRARVQKTWLLQNRLRFEGRTGNPVRLLGHVILCGTLHVTWQSKRENIPHEYMACVLFKSYLILASVTKHDSYKVKFAIPLAVAHIEGVNQGKGLYCPNAPHTWKVVFEADHRVYEVLLSACSDAEQNMWTNLTQERISTETQDYREYNFTNTSLRVSTPSDIRSIGEAVGRPGTLARHQSLHRNASASALECNGRYIIINSLLSSTDPSYSSDKPIKRSYSAPTVNDRSGVPIINLKRSERNQIEAKLEDVWTKELLPYNATQVVKEPNGIKRLSMMSLISHKKSTSSTSSASEYSDYTVFEDDDGDGDKAIRRQSMKSFRSKSSSPRSTPPSPTKRSSSLRSRLSLGSSTKNSPVSASDTLSSNLSSQRRNMRPLPEGKRKLSERSEAALMNTIYMSPVTTSDTNPEWESQDSYFSINKPVAPPTPPTSVQEDGGSVNKAKVAGLRKDGKRTMSLQLAGAVKEDPACNRRHTLVIHQSSRPWRTARRKKMKRPSQDISREWKAPEKMTPQALMSVKHGLL